jgi:sporulation protein YlmC with PRC-barrel domain
MVVYSKNMEKVGEVKNFEINIEDMKITHLIITLENKATKEILGKRRLIRQKKDKIDTQSIEAIKDAVILRQPIDNLKGIIKRL